MDKRDDILKDIKGEDRELIAKIIDQVTMVERYFEPRFTFFLDPAEITKAKKVLDKYWDVKFSITSGIENCERNIIAIYPDYMSMGDVELPVSVLSISGSSKFEKISHRDILGALMSLGVKREKIGDIYLDGDKYYVLVYSDISYYIIMNLTRIKHTPVEIQYVDFDSVPGKNISYKTITSTVSSLRLDAVLSAAFGESRSSISKEVLRGSVKVNWEVITDLSHSVREGDTISLRGRGRAILDSVGNQTKKGRIMVTIKKVL